MKLTEQELRNIISNVLSNHGIPAAYVVANEIASVIIEKESELA